MMIMTVEDVATRPLAEDPVWAAGGRPPRRRLRGVSISVLPSGPLVAQVLGVLAVLVGVFLAVAVAWCVLGAVAVTLILGGGGSAVLGALREAGKL